MTDSSAIAESLRIPEEPLTSLRREWLTLIDIALWGELKADRPGTLGRLRKRLLEAAENLRSVANDRAWIPQERERIKGTLGASVKLRDGLAEVERLLEKVDGPDQPRLRQAWDHWHSELDALLSPRENQWAQLLETYYDDDPAGDETDPG